MDQIVDAIGDYTAYVRRITKIKCTICINSEQRKNS